MNTFAKSSLSAVIAFCAMTGAGLASAAEAAPKVTDDLLKLGEATYKMECASCHGAEGDGKGPGAYILNPKPRNFQLGVYKFRSTSNGEAPTPEDLYKTITNGIAISMMPSFKSLPDEKRWALTHYVLKLGGLEEEEPMPIEVPSEPARSDSGLKNGKEVYARLKCANCHGDDGFGGGPSWTTLENDAKERTFPTNLTTGVYKGGSDPKDLYLRIASGLDGSPMPSYADEATPEEIWNLVHYMQSFVK